MAQRPQPTHRSSSSWGWRSTIRMAPTSEGQTAAHSSHRMPSVRMQVEVFTCAVPMRAAVPSSVKARAPDGQARIQSMSVHQRQGFRFGSTTGVHTARYGTKRVDHAEGTNVSTFVAALARCGEGLIIANGARGSHAGLGRRGLPVCRYAQAADEVAEVESEQLPSGDWCRHVTSRSA